MFCVVCVLSCVFLFFLFCYLLSALFSLASPSGKVANTSWHISMHLRAGGGRAKGGRRAAKRQPSLCICGRAAADQATNISMHLRAGGGRQSDKHLYASAGGRRAAQRPTSQCICRRAAGGKKNQRKNQGKNQGIPNEPATHRSNEKLCKKTKKNLIKSIILGRFQAPFSRLGASLGRLGASWPVLAASWGVLAPTWPVLAPAWPVEVPSSAVLAPSWAVLGATWARLGLLGASWGDLGLPKNLERETKKH